VISRIERLRVGPIGENVYAIESRGVGVLVDPGDEPAKILAFLEEKNISVSLVVLTHGHLDHAAALPDLLIAWQDRHIPIAIHPSDAHYLGARGEMTNKALFEAISAPSFFNNYWKPLPEPELFLNDGDFVPGTSLRVIHTPGHSAGSICLYDEEAGFVVSGDTLFRDGIGRTDSPDADPILIVHSLQKLVALPPETVVFPGHGPRTTIERETPHIIHYR